MDHESRRIRELIAKGNARTRDESNELDWLLWAAAEEKSAIAGQLAHLLGEDDGFGMAR